MRKQLFFMVIILLSVALLVSCKGDDKAKEKKDEAETKIQQVEDKIINLGSLGFTTDDLIKNWNEAQAEMKDSDKIDQINVRNGEFKHDVNDGMILEGIVNETTNEVIRLSIVKKDREAENLNTTLDKYEDTIAAFFLLVAVTNTEEAVKDQDIGKVTYKLGLLRDKDKKINGTATLNNVTYKAEENERGLVLSAVEKRD
ncbi:hypothetical protein RGU12_15490 [Fredinandcohnia sp. QZ13]|uniref:hypothetical protein n=1 Tax=Fredinandcohnia sp. QZ13 TaxID=3073144 RepID=UPI00285373A8|nr:hypothetical protein [Fredinandcohnia sp. QZ13]MDR4888912.1 hypothetical protein [Fredinandcohnia sp. QZ13]